MSTSSQPVRLRSPEWRVEGRAKVTGGATYVPDLRVAGMLYVAFQRSPYPHARIVSVDATGARTMPGVCAVMTGEDVRPYRLGRRLQDWPLLAWDRVRLVGDPVAAVAAETEAQAEAAAAAISVVYEELPGVFDASVALDPDAAILHPDATEHRYLGGEKPVNRHQNIQGHNHYEHGDVDAALARAVAVFTHRFATARTFHGHLEPHATIVWMDGDVFHIKSTNKSPFRLRDALEGSLDIPPDQLVIDSDTIGGDFGGKGFSVDDYLLIILARATGRPVRSVLHFRDDLSATNTRHAAVIEMRTGVDADGRILATETTTRFDGGAYAAAKGNVQLVPGGSLHTLPGYEMPATRTDVTCVYTNQVPGGHARAPGQPQNTFAAESHLDLVARAIGVDPLEFRLRNAIRDGGTDVMGRRWPRSSMPQVIERLRAELPWDASLPDGHGRGMAIGARSSPSGERTAIVELAVLADGRVDLLTAVPDQGGGAYTMLQRVAAEALGLPLDRIRVRRGTTAEVAYDLGVGGSRVTPVVGGAALAGGRVLATVLDERWPGIDREAQLVRAAQAGDVRATGEYEHPGSIYATYAYGAIVSVDRDTGRVSIVDSVFVADVGTVINPLGLRGQLVGAIVSGIGQALTEEVLIDDGQITTAHLGDYSMPAMRDVPPLRIALVDGGDGAGPYGAKSAAELGNVPVGPAIANAVHDAVGVRITSLPITPEKVLRALEEASVQLGTAQGETGQGASGSPGTG